ncbi:uncharacterized protein LOC125146461 [Prionailurus viverrinus]|uniref:uncharacterized protein LOC125146461 n=1 Tax=Prionailurus viverrinus TaxID=61388 RepID=UPI001FF4B19D|nr:uncharacterized protein LOC125146461 [Prionailurus viverrinus]
MPRPPGPGLRAELGGRGTAPTRGAGGPPPVAARAAAESGPSVAATALRTRSAALYHLTTGAARRGLGRGLPFHPARPSSSGSGSARRRGRAREGADSGALARARPRHAVAPGSLRRRPAGTRGCWARTPSSRNPPSALAGGACPRPGLRLAKMLRSRLASLVPGFVSCRHRTPRREGPPPPTSAGVGCTSRRDMWKHPAEDTEASPAAERGSLFASEPTHRVRTPSCWPPAAHPSLKQLRPDWFWVENQTQNWSSPGRKFLGSFLCPGTIVSCMRDKADSKIPAPNMRPGIGKTSERNVLTSSRGHNKKPLVCNQNPINIGTLILDF